MRKIEFDILKGILIILVVVGHTDIQVPYADFMWFLMPIFFMVTGYLTKRWLSVQDIISDCKIILNGGGEQSTIKKIIRLLLPYFAYSIVLYLVFQPESILKNTARVLYAGANNTTIYSYPFWFINALLVSNIIYGTIKKSKYSIYIIIAIYIFIHLNIIQQIPLPLPWSIDSSLGAVCFLCIGDKLKNYEFKKWHLFLLILVPIFIVCNEVLNIEYKINMKSMLYNNAFLDLLVPLSFALFLYSISLLLAKVKYLSSVLSYFSICSITIFYMHASFLNICKPYFSSGVSVVIALLLCVCIHTIFNKTILTQKIFLGK